MKDRCLKTRIITILLALVLVLPVPVFGTEEAGAAVNEDPVTETEFTDENVTGEEDGTAAGTENGDGDVTPDETGAENGDGTGNVIEPEAEPEDEPAEPGTIENVTIEENPSGTVVIEWDAFSGAVCYEVSSLAIDEGAPVMTEECSQTFTGLKHGADYDFVIAAYDENDAMIAVGTVHIKTVAFSVTYNEASYRKLSSKTISPKKKFNINLTSMIKESNNGYSVVQGGCTDGTYAYYLMVSTKTQKGRVLKVRMSNNKVVARSKVLNVHHGNGMTYDSKRKKLVVIARDNRKQEITVIDASSLKITRQQNVKYDNFAGAEGDTLNSVHQSQGLAAIAYVRKYDCYIALERTYHNLLIFDPDTLQAIGMVKTDIGENYPGTFQGMDADDRYVYLLLSAYNKNGKSQPYNLIVALDWNSENLLPVVNATKSKDPKYVEEAWYCNNDGSGTPDAVIRVRTSYEAENIYHTTDKNGKEHFYLSEYRSKPVYKKVRKRVKVNGKWKRKKVWKLRYIKRDNYVYDLGVI